MSSDPPVGTLSTVRATAVPRPTWRTRLANWAFASRPADRILKRRAAYLVNALDIADQLKPGGVYVDVGSGTGHNSARMAQVARGLKARFVCVEPVSRPTRRVLRRVDARTDGLVQFVRAVGNRLPIPDEYADGVSVFFVLHHIPYPIQLEVLVEIKRVLKPGGLLFVWEDTPENEREYAANEVWDRRLNFEPRSEPHFYRRSDQWSTLFVEHGLTPVKRVDDQDVSRRRHEGLIRHTGFVLRCES